MKVRDHKSLVAKLLATENIKVRYDKVSTASFNPVGRELILPIYKTELSNDELDLFIGHEVGHALFTPAVNPQEYSKGRPNFHDVLNVVEDARIERLVQEKFPGLKRNFVNGYRDLIDRKFFGQYDPKTLGFVNRINLWFKTKDPEISFSPEEMQIVEEIENSKTFEEVLDITERIFSRYSDNPEQNRDEDKEEQEEQQTDDSQQGDENENESTAGSSEESEQDNEDQDSKNDSRDNEQDNSDIESDSGNDQDSLDDGEDSDTDDEERSDSDNDSTSVEEDYSPNNLDTSLSETAENSLKDLVETDDGFQYRDKLIPTDVSRYIVSNSDIQDILDNHRYGTDENGIIRYYYDENNYDTIFNKIKDDELESNWIEFQNQQKSVVNYMVKEFEMRKSADEHKRSRESKTGTLNLNVLHKYKFSEDLFRKNMIVKDGKNHGLFMLIDWSGSMASHLRETIDQLQVLIMFCKKVNIPFEVYAFTNHFFNTYSFNTYSWSRIEDNVPDDLDLDEYYYGDGFRLLELCNSSFKKNEFLRSMKILEMFKLTRGGFSTRKESYPPQLYLGGTPFGQSALCSIPLINKFTNKHNIQIVNTIFLSDGEGNDGPYVVVDTVDGKVSKRIYANNYTKIVFRGIRNDYSYKLNRDDRWDNTDLDDYIFEVLKGECPQSNVIGFFVGSNNQSGLYTEVKYCSVSASDPFINWDSTKEFLRKSSNETFIHGKKGRGIRFYDDLFITVPKKMIIDDSDWEITEEIKKSKAKLRSSFSKKMNGKNNSRSFLKKFTEIIA